MKVLIVEDEWILAAGLESVLEQLGQNVVGLASHAAQALAIAKEEMPDLAFVDVNLSDGATGPHIASELARANNVCVVFVTGNPEQIPPDFAGAIGAIAKPIAQKTVEQLLPYVREYRQRDPSSKLPSPPDAMSLAPGLAA